MTEGTPRGPSPPTGGWRGRADISPNAAKRVSRVLLTLVALSLLGALGYLLWSWGFRPATRLVCLPVVEYQKLAVPPIPFSERDVESLGQLPLSEPAAVWQNLGTSADMAKMPNRLEGLGSRPKDTLIFYLCAHGVSNGDTAYLLSSDYLLGTGNERYALGELLDQLRAVPGALKLLILDVGTIASDPRLGMLANEFPEMLRDELAAGKTDSNLWVLSANRPMQVSHVSAESQRSIFGQCALEGLLGAADGDNGGDGGGEPDGRVDLDELVRYVCRGVRVRVSNEVGNADAQTPWLLRDGLGEVDSPPATFLVLAADQPVDAQPAAADETADKSDKASAPRDPARQAAEKSLDALRQLHDQIDDQARRRDPRGAGPSWAPVDYAPHQWRVFEEMLVSYELQHLYGMPVPEAALKRLLEDAAREWPVATGGLKTDAEVGFDPAAQGIERAGPVRALVQLRNDLLGAAPYYVRWYTRTALAATGSQPAAHKLILDLLRDTKDFADDYGELEQAGRDEAPPDDLRARLARLQQAAEGLRKQDGTLRQTLDAKVDDLAANPTARGNPCQIEILLGLPLLSGRQRTRLLDALAKAKWPVPELRLETVDPGRLNDGAARFAQRQKALLPELADLEQALCLLAAPGEPIEPPAPAASPEPAAYRQFASRLQEFYQGLPGKVNAVIGSASPDDAAIRAAQRRLRLVRACDVGGKISEPRDWPLVRGILWHEVVLAGPQESLRLTWSEPATLPITIRTSGQPFDRATVTLRFDAARVRVLGGDGSQTIEPGRPATVALGREETVLQYDVVALADNTGAASAEVEVSVRAGTQEGSCKTALLLPSPDVVRLSAYRVSGAGEVPMEEISAGRIRLRPLPNRETGFRFALENLSDEAKQLEVRLLGVPNRPWGVAPSQAMLLDVAGNLRSEVEAIAPPVTMDLPANAAARTIPLALPETPGPTAAPPGAAPPGAAPPGAAQRPPPRPTTWACAVYDKGDAAATGPKWVFWLDILPLVPREYLSIEGGRPAYDADAGRLTILASPRRTDARGRPILPGDLADNPIVVTWNPDNGGDLRNLRRQAQIASPNGMAELFADVAPEVGRVVGVDLDADGYPRAFMYRVQCQRNGEIVDMQDRIDVRLTSPAPGRAYRVPLEEPIAVAFAVDAPADAFLETSRTTARPVVRLQFVGAEGVPSFSPVEIGRFSADRQVEVFVPKIGPSGVLVVRTQVHDFSIETSNRGLENAKVRLQVLLELPNLNLPADIGTREDSVDLVFDSEPPIVRISPPGETPLGQPVRLAFEVEDLSGLGRIQARLGESREAKFQDADVLNLAARPNAENRYSASLPTDELKRAGTYWLVWQATDRAGNTTDPMVEPITIRAPRSGGTPAAPTTGSIEGWVVSTAGESRAGALVTLKPLGRTAEAGTDGKFAFAEVPPGTYTLVVEQRIKGQQASTSKQVEVKAGEKLTVEKIELSMWSRDDTGL